MRMRTIAVLVVLLSAGSAWAQKARWVETHAWTGRGTKQTEMFLVHGAKWRMRYRPRGRGDFRIDIHDENGTYLKSAADFQAMRLLSGHKTLRGRGNRYLSVRGFNTHWTITIEQYLSVIEEWHLTQVMRQPAPELFKVATWTGETVQDQTHQLDIGRGSWQIVYSKTEGGFLKLVAQTADGHVNVVVDTAVEGSGDTWVHQAGTATVTIHAADTRWKVDVYSEH